MCTDPMSGNPSAVKLSRMEAGLASSAWPSFTADCAPEIAEAVTTFVALLRVSDALVHVSRTIGARRRRAKEQGSSQVWWPDLNRELIREHIDPLHEDLLCLEASARHSAAVALDVLLEARSALEQAESSRPIPGHKSDLRLVEECLQPLFETLQEVVALDIGDELSKDPHGGAVLVREIGRRSLREWFEHDEGAELGALLEYLVLGECETEAYHDGLYRNLFERADDRFLCSLGERHVRWNESAIEALLVAIDVVRQRMDAKQTRKRRRDTPAATYFCELCDELTQRMFNECASSTAGTGSTRYCERHASGDRHLYQSDVLKRREFHWLHAMVLAEAKNDASYKDRFLPANARRVNVAEHTDSCFFCSGRPFETECFNPASEYFSSLMAFHANVRKVAYLLAHGYHDGRAFLLDEAAQRGDSVKEAAHGYRLNTDKAVGQHSGLALARLLGQGKKGSEIAACLGISPSAVSQRKASLRGAFDFSSERHMELVWWPFDDIGGSDVAKFPSRPLGWDWRHSEDEYRHLSRAGQPQRNDHCRAGSSSSLPTRSSARR